MVHCVEVVVKKYYKVYVDDDKNKELSDMTETEIEEYVGKQAIEHEGNLEELDEDVVEDTEIPFDESDVAVQYEYNF